MHSSYQTKVRKIAILCYDASHMSINKDQRRKLKKLAHHIKPFANIGKQGLTEGVIHSIKDKIEKDELIKVKFSQNKEDKGSLSKKIIKETRSEEVCLIGHTLILYKKSKNPQNRHIKI